MKRITSQTVRAQKKRVAYSAISIAPYIAAAKMFTKPPRQTYSTDRGENERIN